MIQQGGSQFPHLFQACLHTWVQIRIRTIKEVAFNAKFLFIVFSQLPTNESNYKSLYFFLDGETASNAECNEREANGDAGVRF